MTIGAIVIILAGIKLAADLIIPILLAFILALVCLPPLYWLRKKGIPIGVAVGLIITGFAGTIVLFVATVGTSLQQFSSALPRYTQSLQNMTGSAFNWLAEKGIDLSQYESALNDAFNPSAAMQMAGDLLRGAGGAASSFFMLILTVTFILFEVTGIPAKLSQISSSPKDTVEAFEKFIDSLKRYIGIKTLVSLMTGVIVTIWLTVVGVDFAILWGTIAFALNFIPTIGSIIAAVPAVLLALVQLGPGAAIWSAVGFLLANLVIGNVVEPRLTGKSLGLSTLVVFLSLIIWGWFLGPVGMLLSVPLTMSIKIALEMNPETRRWAILLSTPAKEDQST